MKLISSDGRTPSCPNSTGRLPATAATQLIRRFVEEKPPKTWIAENPGPLVGSVNTARESVADSVADQSSKVSTKVGRAPAVLTDCSFIRRPKLSVRTSS